MHEAGYKKTTEYKQEIMKIKMGKVETRVKTKELLYKKLQLLET
jgi:hypothetical protein